MIFFINFELELCYYNIFNSKFYTQVKMSNEKHHLVIGKGSFGNVYLNSSKEVIKRMKLIENTYEDDDNSETEIVYSTIREIAFLSYFKHENIANLTFIKRIHNEIDVGMEFGGQSLADLMHKYSLKKRANMLLSISYQVLKVLHYLEVNNIVHSDLKPSNIVINSDGKVRLIDWGGVCFQGNKHSVSLCSTKTFKSPEQRSDFTKEPETGCFNDIFSFGLTMFTFLFNKQPGDLFIKNNKVNLLKVFDIDLETFCDIQDMSLAQLLLSTLTINHNRRPTASELINSSVFDELRKEYIYPKEEIMELSFINQKKLHCKKFQKKLNEIMDTFRLHKFNMYANMLFQLFNNTQESKEMIKKHNDYEMFLPQFCLDLCIILFDDEKNSRFYDFDEYDTYFEIRDEMIRKLLNAVKFNIYKKI